MHPKDYEVVCLAIFEFRGITTGLKLLLIEEIKQLVLDEGKDEFHE